MSEIKSLNTGAIPEKLLEAVVEIAALVRQSGGRAYMVGGSVRDLLAGKKSVKDVDIEVFGIEPGELERIIGSRYEFDACGLSFGVLKIKHLDIDVSLPRRESKRGIGHRGFLIDSDPSLSVQEAASRRDFTVNALYYDPLNDRIEDPYGGRSDLAAGILRHVSAKFSEDPLRVLRGMQFVARFGLTPAPETVEICRAVSIEDLPPERLFEEWAKLLTKGTAIGKGLEFLRATGWVRYFPELEALIGCRQDQAWHAEGDVWNHTCLCLDSFARHRVGDYQEDLIVGLAVLCHDFGKPLVTCFSDGHIRAIGHDVAGAEPAMTFLRRLTREERILRDVVPLITCHMQPFSLWAAKAGDSAVRRLAAKVGRIDRLVRVSSADDEGRIAANKEETSGGKDIEWLANAAERLRIADSKPKPILLGRHLIGFGLTPSPDFRKWLDLCYEAQLDGLFSTEEEAISYFKEKCLPFPSKEDAARAR